jgi:putative flippase GtrA
MQTDSQLPARPLHRLLRSASVGAAASLADLSALFLLVHRAGFTPAQANLPALLLGVAAQFLGNKLYAFEDRSRGRALVAQSGKFALVELGAFALNALLFQLLIARTPAPYLLARICAAALVYFGYSFPLWGRIFRQEPARC